MSNKNYPKLKIIIKNRRTGNGDCGLASPFLLDYLKLKIFEFGRD